MKWLAPKTYPARNQVTAEVFDYIERFYNPTRRPGYVSPMDFEKLAPVA